MPAPARRPPPWGSAGCRPRAAWGRRRHSSGSSRSSLLCDVVEQKVLQPRPHQEHEPGEVEHVFGPLVLGDTDAGLRQRIRVAGESAEPSCLIVVDAQ
ncbi:hypothetical protein [Ornithinimicrobium kibberense]|uniref:hypothetical protein n=1 Tax=Ornithinimicrobium kibberense TaxID=282060 RepID=UPI00360BAB89